MAQELAFVFINPYTIAKSRTGGVIARCIGRTDLNLVAARMMGPPLELVEAYAESLRNADRKHPETCALLADYVSRAYAPNPQTGRPQRVMLLLFEGENAVEKIWKTAGSATKVSASGQTIRDTYGDYILNERNEVQYFEPAVLVAPTVKRAGFTLRLWARYSEAYGGIIDSAADVPSGEDVQVTLVMLKPDNFRYPSLRAGNIIDILSRSGLRIVGAKRFAMSKEQAERFYGPVRDALRSRFADIGAERAAKVLAKEFGFDVEPELCRELCARLGPRFADIQFRNIVDFITGDSCAGLPAGAGHKAFDMHSLLRGLWTRLRGVETRPAAPKSPGAQGCLALVYEGVNAVQTIREILGPTDPSKAAPGSVRREFGSDIMVNAAHASDSAGNARREMQIINIKEDTIGPWVQKYYGKTA